MLSEYQKIVFQNQEVKNQRCHNCGVSDDQSSEGISVQINDVKGWFCLKSCFDSWNSINERKYQGGIITP